MPVFSHQNEQIPLSTAWVASTIHWFVVRFLGICSCRYAGMMSIKGFSWPFCPLWSWRSGLSGCPAPSHNPGQITSYRLSFRMECPWWSLTRWNLSTSPFARIFYVGLKNSPTPAFRKLLSREWQSHHAAISTPTESTSLSRPVCASHWNCESLISCSTHSAKTTHRPSY